MHGVCTISHYDPTLIAKGDGKAKMTLSRPLISLTLYFQEMKMTSKAIVSDFDIRPLNYKNCQQGHAK